MIDLSIWHMGAIATAFFLAGIVKGVTGMGLPTVAMGALGALLSPIAAANLLILPSLVTNVWQLMAGPAFVPLMRRLWPMMLAIGIGTIIGTSLLAGGGTVLSTAMLGGALVLYAGYTLVARPFSVSARVEAWLSAPIGAITGMVTGCTGVFVMPAVPYLQALGLDKDDLIQALGLSFTLSTMSLAAGLWWRGAFAVDNLLLSALSIVPALAGMWAGQVIRRLISPARFRRWFLIGLMLLGAELALWPFF
ncbi:sulfite exporter TauE/SafE family protein [Ensifer canadensis]